jgi:hypothetical protein
VNGATLPVGSVVVIDPRTPNRAARVVRLFDRHAPTQTQLGESDIGYSFRWLDCIGGRAAEHRTVAINVTRIDTDVRARPDIRRI